MTLQDDPDSAMRREDLDRELADRLFGGQLDPADAPAGLGELVALVRAAGGPSTSDELAGERVMVEAMVATQDAIGVSPVGRKPVLVRAMHTRAAALVALSALGVGAVAAAVTANRSDERVVTGGPTSDPIVVTVPTTIASESTSSTTSSTSSTTTSTSSTTTAATAPTTLASAAPAPQSASGVGPDATGPAAFGLCVAWTAQAGQVDPTSEAFRNLDAAAAAAGQSTADYCAQVVEDGPPPAGRPRPGQDDDPDLGPPADVPGATAPGRQGNGATTGDREPDDDRDDGGPPPRIPGPPAGIPGGRP